MKRTLFAIATVLPLLAGFIPTAHAAGCAAGATRAGCAGPNGAVVTGPNGVRKTSPLQPAPASRARAATPRPRERSPGAHS